MGRDKSIRISKSKKKSGKKVLQHDRTIRGQIRSNNNRIIIIILALVVLSTLNLGLIDWYQYRENRFSNQAEEVKDYIIRQYQWIDNIKSSVLSGTAATVELDAEKCDFTDWIHTLSAPSDEETAEILQSAYDAHEELHKAGGIIMALSSNDRNVAINKINQTLPAISDKLFTSLENVASSYTELADKNHNNLVSRIIWAVSTNVLLALIAFLLAKKFGDKLAGKISKPIAAVADWSEELSRGSADLDFDISIQTSTDLEEISRMIESFRIMANSIQENVRVVQKVADGDMTAFVNVRSNNDSLGQNLYRMVQSNDLMFAEISGIANSVAEGAQNISQASSALAESCSVQAGAVKDFTDMIRDTSEFITSNNQKARDAIVVSDEINKEISASTEEMDRLLDAMEEIRKASEKVSAIIKTIDDIAGQTNLLALNATTAKALPWWRTR